MPASRRPKTELRDAEDEDPPGRRQALQGDRDGQDHPPQGVPRPPAREEAHQAHPPPRGSRGGHRRRQEARRAPARARLIFSVVARSTDPARSVPCHTAPPTRSESGVIPMARVKRSIHSKKSRRKVLAKAE